MVFAVMRFRCDGPGVGHSPLDVPSQAIFPCSQYLNVKLANQIFNPNHKLISLASFFKMFN